MISNRIALYIGAPIEHESERAVLVELMRQLEERGEDATVLVNFNVKGRQLDLVLGTNTLTLVLEAKSSTAPLRGSVNGSWAALTRSGQWKETRNAYLQVLGEKNALRDALFECHGLKAGYPDAHVVFVPELKAGSQIPSDDLKVTSGGLRELSGQLGRRSGLCCTSAQWAEFAVRQGLERIYDLSSALDASLHEAQQVLARYAAAFTATYASIAARYVADSYEVDREMASAPELEYLLTEGRENLLLQGPSGCGKSLLSLVLANKLCSRGTIPIIVEGRSFEGQLSSALDAEASLLDARSATKLLAAARALSRPVAVIVDGYNECSADQRFRLTRTLRAASLRYDAAVIVSSQIEMERADLLPLRKVSVLAPSHELKVKIASLDPAAAEMLAPLLRTINTGIEASLVGELQREVKGAYSRSALFDSFVRRRLGSDASPGITLLCCIAELLFERVTFSLSAREVDRIQTRERLSVETLQSLRRAGLLVLHGDRLSFVHEMYLNAFAAEAIVRRFGSDVEALLEVLRKPRFKELCTFVVGALEDRNVLECLLRTTEDASLIRACVLGECGSDAKQLTMASLNAVMGILEREAESVRFSIESDQMWGIGVEPETRIAWSNHERALLSELPSALAQEDCGKGLLKVIEKLDHLLSQEFSRLRSDAIEKGLKMLRSSLFAVAYVFGQREMGIALVMSTLHSGSMTRLGESPERQAFLEHVWVSADTPGQFYLALSLSHASFRLPRNVLNLAVERALPLLRAHRWKFLPYHLQLDLMNFVHFLPRDDTPVREKVIEVLEDLLPELHPLLQSIALEALSGLGAMDDQLDDHGVQVQHAIARILQEQPVENAAEIAWGIYNAQFDHPFESAYIKAIEDLSEEDRQRLMRLACEGASEHSFFLGSLIDSIAKAEDVCAVPAISRWAKLPNPASAMPQGAVEVYISALIALGRLKANLTSDICPIGLGPKEDAMSACGIICYWLQRREAEAVDIEQIVKAAFETLSTNPSIAMGVLCEISRSIMTSDKRGVLIVTAFPERAVVLARSALQSGRPLEGYFPVRAFQGDGDAERFAISLIETYGDASDLPLLRAFADHGQLSGSVRKALASIESRM